jgi:hypothetical protein
VAIEVERLASPRYYRRLESAARLKKVFPLVVLAYEERFQLQEGSEGLEAQRALPDGQQAAVALLRVVRSVEELSAALEVRATVDEAWARKVGVE